MGIWEILSWRAAEKYYKKNVRSGRILFLYLFFFWEIQRMHTNGNDPKGERVIDAEDRRKDTVGTKSLWEWENGLWSTSRKSAFERNGHFYRMLREDREDGCMHKQACRFGGGTMQDFLLICPIFSIKLEARSATKRWWRDCGRFEKRGENMKHLEE